MIIFVGADPGLSGALGFLDEDGRYLGVRDMPTTEIPGAGRIKRRIHGGRLYHAIATFLGREQTAIALVEDVQAWGLSQKKGEDGEQQASSGPGASTMAAMVGTKYVILAAFDMFGGRITIQTIPPQSWKASFGLKKNKRAGASRQEIQTEFKAQSRARAVALWPEAEIRLSSHDGRAEALLLAEFARLRWIAERDLFEKNFERDTARSVA